MRGEGRSFSNTPRFGDPASLAVVVRCRRPCCRCGQPVPPTAEPLAAEPDRGMIGRRRTRAIQGLIAMVLSTTEWDTIRAAFHAGAAVRYLARTHAVDESTIREKARRFGWQRDPAASPRPERGTQAAPPTAAPAEDRSTAGGTAGKGATRRADRRAAKQQRFDAVVTLLDVVMSQPPSDDAAAQERKAQALATLAADGGIAVHLLEASKLMLAIGLPRRLSAPDSPG